MLNKSLQENLNKNNVFEYSIKLSIQLSTCIKRI